MIWDGVIVTSAASMQQRPISLILLPIITATFIAFAALPITLSISIVSAILAVSLGVSYCLLPEPLRVRMTFWRKPPLSPHFSE